MGTELLDVVRGVVDVGVGLGLRLRPEEAQIAVRDPVEVEPRRRVADRSLSSAEDIVQRLNEDRAELARRLDAAEARAERRAEANRIVSARLVKIMEMVRAVLDGRARDA